MYWLPYLENSTGADNTAIFVYPFHIFDRYLDNCLVQAYKGLVISSLTSSF